MSTPEEPIGDARETLEGGYTEADGEGPHERTVHGRYTDTDTDTDAEGDARPEPDVEGGYTGREAPADAPEGDYTSGDTRQP
jgi:hypothetical protein